MPEIQFCQIDTKGSGSYCPVEIWPSDKEKGDSYGRPANTHNDGIMLDAKIEYLNRLLELQKDIKEKYEPNLIENTRGEDEPDPAGNWEEHEQKERELLKAGADDLYYT